MRRPESAAVRKVKRETLSNLLQKHGGIQGLADHLGVTYSAVHERADRYGLIPKRRTPEEIKARLECLLRRYKTPTAMARATRKHVNTIRWALDRYGVEYTPERPLKDGDTRAERKAWLRTQLRKHGNCNRVAKALGITASAVYERAHTYGIKVVA